MAKMSSLERVADAEKNVFDALYKRMDRHRALYTNPYTLATGDGPPIPGQISVTMNDAAVFLNAVMSWTISAIWQTVVEGDISTKRQKLIEQFLDDREAQSEEQLSRTEFGRDKYFTALNINARGWIAARRLWRTDKDGKLWLQVVPIDARYLSYERNESDYNWVGVRWNRSRARVKSDYGVDL